LNFGTFVSNQGYAYNWANAGATTTDLLNQNQDDNVRGQVNSGQVTLVCAMIGNNDFSKEYDSGSTHIHNYGYIYSGNDWHPVVNTAINNLKAAVNTVMSGSTAKMVLATIPDPELTPALRAGYSDPIKRQRVSDAIAEYNRRIVAEVETLYADRIAIADVYQVSLDVMAELKKGNNYFVGGYEIDLYNSGNTPDKVILGDYIHPGTIMQGLMARKFITGMNELGATLPQLTDGQILHMAGVPEPVTALFLIMGGLTVIRRRF
jgi:phospholipase/lecithinase/hemolysin